MSVNRYKPHVLVLPEDDANRQLANGFLSHSDLSYRNIQILEEAGGWNEVVSRFLKDHVFEMDRLSNRFMVLLIDFDGEEGRLQLVRAQIPNRLADRVFVLGAFGEPEELKKAVPGSYESIGLKMAEDCREARDDIWGHSLLRHNASELARLRESVRPILFPTP